MSTATKSLSERLLDGARMLGNLWRRGKRCKRGWALGEHEMLALVTVPPAACPCTEKTDFCKARILWMMLALQNGQDIDGGDYGLALSMTVTQWDATGLTMTVESEKAGTLQVGSRAMISASHLRKLSEDPASAVSIFSLTRTFPKAKIEGVIEPPMEQIA